LPRAASIPLELGVVLVLGANIGGGVIAVMLSRAPPSRWRASCRSAI
jgi:Na+/phosphate symporter